MATVPGKRKATVASEPVTYERIALRAYELYLQRGARPDNDLGDDLNDWLAAECELMQAPVKRVKKAVVAMTAEPTAATKKTVKATTTRRKTKNGDGL